MDNNLSSIESKPVEHVKEIPPVTINKLAPNLSKIIITLLATVVVGLGAVVYILIKHPNLSPFSNPVTSTPTSTISPTAIISQQTPLFSGQLKRLSQNLMLFKYTEDDKLNGIPNDFVYYEAGKFAQGELKDYSRVIAIRPSGGPGDPLAYTLATKDYQTYILNDPDNKTTQLPETDYQNPYSVLDKTKITSTAAFVTEHTKEINLDKLFSLYQENLPVETKSTGKKDSNNNDIYETILTTDFSSYQKLTSPFSDLTFYYKPYSIDTSYLNQVNQTDKDILLLKQKYFITNTEVLVVDSIGLPVNYSLTTPASIQNYTVKENQYNLAYKNYQEQLIKYQNKEISDYPQYVDYVYPPSLGFLSSQVTNQTNQNFFKDYESAIPDACAGNLNSRVINVSAADLEQVGTVYGLPLYRLKDANHPLYTLAFNNKLAYYDQDPTAWNDVNKGTIKPTFSEYVSSNPLLFIKDYWGRFVVLGEYDIKLPGGCGKPVVYLYPEKPTPVTVKFNAPIQFTTDIPKYTDFWSVLAYPNGSLVNLKAALTDCSQIDTTKNGSEYAQEACQKNVYPYLYWAGNVTSASYPVIDKGWIVNRGDLHNFLQATLNEVGLNENEKNDFIAYWLPAMISKNAPYYRLSFLQTSDLNILFPMTVNPKPDTIFRLFLDFQPLANKPQSLPQPQILNKLTRHGFTLVEWGGLKQP